MKGDFTRRTFNPYRSYSSVQMQQGRVQLDSDWNEQADINLRRERRFLRDIIGPGATPWKGADEFDDPHEPQFGFFIDADTASGRAFIGHSLFETGGELAARIYVDGVLVEHKYATLDVKIPEWTMGATTIGIEVPSLFLPDGRKLEVGTLVVFTRKDFPIENQYPFTFIFEITSITGNMIYGSFGDPLSDTWLATTGKLTVVYEYQKQPYYLNVPNLPTSGNHIAYLDVWRRHVTATEASSLREPALGGPDTATRTQTIWQMKLKEGTAASVANGTWADSLKLPPAGWMRVRYNPAPGQVQALENRLYRVEIHKGGAKPSAGMTGTPAVTLKWSRDNGAQVAPWTSGNGPVVVATQGRDEALGFAKNQWIELSDDDRDFRGQAGVIVQITDTPAPTDGGQSLTISSAPAGETTNFASYTGNPKVRRWDSGGGTTYPLDAKHSVGAWIPLENGIEVQFDQDAIYQTGDYWLIPARPSLNGIEWPQNAGQPLPQFAQRTEHVYFPVSVVTISGMTVTAESVRQDFYSLVELTKRLRAPTTHYMTILPFNLANKIYNPAAMPPTLVDHPFPNFVLAKENAESVYYLGGFNSDNFGFAAISLPHRAKIVGIKATIAENSQSSVGIRRYAHIDIRGYDVCGVFTTTTSGMKTVITGTVEPGYETIDNENYLYTVEFNRSGSGVTKIYTITIKYEMPGPLAEHF